LARKIAYLISFYGTDHQYTQHHRNTYDSEHMEGSKMKHLLYSIPAESLRLHHDDAKQYARKKELDISHFENK
jgi:hypothetical protein